MGYLLATSKNINYGRARLHRFCSYNGIDKINFYGFHCKTRLEILTLILLVSRLGGWFLQDWSTVT